jgi:hypothetical protein
MATIIPPPDLQQDCLDKLSRALDLVLKTAEAASAENNHKVVIQSAREVTRLAALIHKMTSNTTKPAPSLRNGLAGAKTAKPCAPGKNSASRPEPIGKTDINPDDLIMPDLETLLNPDDMAYWDGLPDNALKKIPPELSGTANHRERWPPNCWPQTREAAR